MKVGTALSLLLKEWLAGPVRYLRAVRAHPHVNFHPGVAVGVGCQFGRYVTVYRDAVLARSAVGDYSYIGGGSTLKHCRLGRFCSVGKGVQIGLGLHPTHMISTYPGFYSGTASGAKQFAAHPAFVDSQPVTIGNDVWIGNNALIVDGIEIGDGAVIAAGAVVTRSVPPYAIVGGVPAKTIRMRFSEEEVQLLMDFRWWDRDEAFLKEHGGLFSEADRFFDALQNHS